MTKKLLLADDSVTIQKVIGIIFATEDYDLHVCDDGEEAFQKALTEYPDLVIADISMPGKDGFELCRAIKAESRLEHTSVLLLPGTFEHFDESQAEAVGADGWISKPFESQALLDKVAQLLEAEPVRLGSAEEPRVGDAVDFSVDEVGVETLDEGIEVEQSVVDEAVLGLAEVDDLGVVPMEAPAEESADDIWDAVSFEEEELQPATDLSAAATDVLDEFAVADDIVKLAGADEIETPDFTLPEEDELELTDEATGFATAEPLELEAVEDVDLELESTVVAPSEALPEEGFVGEEPVFVAEPIEEPAFSAEAEELPAFSTEEDGFEDEEILELAEDDIIDEEPVAQSVVPVVEPVDELVDEPLELGAEEADEEEESFAAEESIADQEFIAEPVYEEPVAELDVVGSAFADGASGEGVCDALEAAEECVAEPVVQAAVATPAVSPVERVEEQLQQLSEDELSEVVGRVAGPIIEKLAGEMLERIVWEVVPDLAESMIREEIRKIRQGAAE